MKRLPLSLIIAFLTLPLLSAQNVSDKIMYKGGTIPDPKFRTYILKNFDTDHNGKISAKEASAVDSIEVRNSGIESLAGIEYFPNLKKLDCANNKFTMLDLSQVPNLEKLYCTSNEITSLDLSKVLNLKELVCGGNKLTTLDLSQVPNLKYLACSDNKLTTLDLSQVPNLEYLICRYNGMLSLNLGGLPNLKKLDCRSNKLTTLNLGEHPNLKELVCYQNQITSLDLSKVPNLKGLDCESNKLTTLDLSRVPNLEKLDCRSNEIATLDLSKAPNLKYLTCSYNEMLSLNLGGLPNLEKLDCEINQITSLDLRQVPNLKELDCKINKLTTLDLSKVSNLERLYCGNNKLTTLDLSQVPNLKELDFGSNPITSFVDLSRVPNLEKLDCSLNNKITSLDLSKLPNLKELVCGDKLNTLDLSKLPNLEYFCCYSPELTSLDFSNNTKIKEIELYHCDSLRYLNVSNLSLLKEFTLELCSIDNLTTVVYNDKTNQVIGLEEILDGLAKAEAKEKARQAAEEQKIRIAEQNRQKEIQKQQDKVVLSRYISKISGYINDKDYIEAEKYAYQCKEEMKYPDAYILAILAKCYYYKAINLNLIGDENMTEYFQAYKPEARTLISKCSASINVDPSDDNEAYFYRGIAYIMLGYEDDAVRDFKHGLDNPNKEMKAVSNYNIGIAYQNAEKYSDAIYYFKNAKTYYTDQSKIKTCLERIKECQESYNKKYNK